MIEEKAYPTDLKSEIFVFKTNIETSGKVKGVRPILDGLLAISDWSVDIQDIDHVLRIVTTGNIVEDAIINTLDAHGFYCEVLND